MRTKQPGSNEKKTKEKKKRTEKTEELKSLQSEIDAIDQKIVSLLGDRQNRVDKIAEIKEYHHLSTYHPAREEDLITSLRDQAKMTKLNPGVSRPGQIIGNDHHIIHIQYQVSALICTVNTVDLCQIDTVRFCSLGIERITHKCGHKINFLLTESNFLKKLIEASS